MMIVPKEPLKFAFAGMCIKFMAQKENHRQVAMRLITFFI